MFPFDVLVNLIHASTVFEKTNDELVNLTYASAVPEKISVLFIEQINLVNFEKSCYNTLSMRQFAHAKNIDQD
jgi:hypothetical protein